MFIFIQILSISIVTETGDDGTGGIDGTGGMVSIAGMASISGECLADSTASDLVMQVALPLIRLILVLAALIMEALIMAFPM